MDENVHGKRPVTQEDVARRAGVSRSIVSYVLNPGSRSVAPETRERILKAIADLGYRPNRYAQNLMRSGRNTVAHRQFGIVLSDVSMLRRPYYAEILAGIHATAHENHHRIQFIRFFAELKDPVLFNALIHDEEISGLILIALDQHIESRDDRDLIHAIRKRVENIVCVEWKWEDIPSVSFDRREAAVQAASHLLSLGRRDIVYIGPRDNRIAGFRHTMAEYGVTIHPASVLDGSTMREGYDACLALLNAKRRPEAILGGSDEVAIGVMRCLGEQGIAVPGEVAIAGIDNMEMAEFSSPPLTSVNIQTMEMGACAVQTLMDMASGRRISASITLPAQLIVRESCGAPKSDERGP